MSEEPDTTDVKKLAALVIASYVANNSVSAADLPALIKATYEALDSAAQPLVEEPEAPAKLTPAQIRKSITPEKIISFLDGRGYSLLKRHLSHQGYTPESYRKRFGLPKDYPMTAPNYSARRSAFALDVGLGRKTVVVAPVAKPKGKRGRPAKADGHTVKPAVATMPPVGVIDPTVQTPS